MFPSDNPFAYPNQPISTLESAQYGGFPEANMDPFPASNENSMYGTPGSLHSRPTGDFPISSNFHGQHLPPHLGQQGRHFSAPMPQQQVFDMQGLMSEPEPLAGNGGISQDDYWSQMNKATTRMGFTPGAGVNLDELFGGDGWNNMWTEQGFPRQ